MRTDDFDYRLPPELIAAEPAPERDASRLLVAPREGGFEHALFRDLPRFLRAGDCLVLNDSRVVPARLIGRRAGGGGKAEVLLLEPADSGEGAWETASRWRAMVKPGRKLGVGSRVLLGDGDDPEAGALVVEEVLDEGDRIVRFEAGSAGGLIDRLGAPPLPPYILSARRSSARREIRKAMREGADPEPPDEFEDEERARTDRERYQTVYARRPGSVAAPTAGLHFTEELLARLASDGVEIRRVSLHVGPGTFAPVKAEDPREHPMHRERFRVEEEDARAIQAAIDDRDRRVVAVGTTVVRTLESLMRDAGGIAPGEGSTDMLILPGHRFRAIDALVTNFHLPRSTLLMLVAAFAGTERARDAYAEAVRERYRFYSYGDACFFERAS